MPWGRSAFPVSKGSKENSVARAGYMRQKVVKYEMRSVNKGPDHVCIVYSLGFLVFTWSEMGNHWRVLNKKDEMKWLKF